MAKKKEPIWIAREFTKCSGCRKCEIACSLYHENRIWPEAITRNLCAEFYGERGRELT